jgi:hypothetical protein
MILGGAENCNVLPSEINFSPVYVGKLIPGAEVTEIPILLSQ